MIDRYGKTIVVGYSEVEKQWMMAAITLPCRERQEAYRDIAQMTGRNLSSVQRYAQVLLSRRRDEVRTYLKQELHAALL